MLAKLQICLRCSKHDGSAITAEEFARVASASTYTVDGLGEEERSVNLVGCSVDIDAFKGRKASERFFGAIGGEVERFATFLNSLDAASFEAFRLGGVNSNLLVEFTIDENMMDFELPATIVLAAARLALPISILVNPE